MVRWIIIGQNLTEEIETMATNTVELDAATALKLIAETTFRPFNDTDWDAFMGCQSENPMIGETADGKFLIVVDDEDVQFVPVSDEVTGDVPDENPLFRLNPLA